MTVEDREGGTTAWRDARGHRRALRGGAGHAAVRRRRTAQTLVRRPLRAHRARRGRLAAARSSVRRNRGARPPRHGVRRSGAAWRGRPAHLGRRRRPTSATPTIADGRASIRLYLQRARRLRAGRCRAWRHGCRCRPARGSTGTASTARSSVPASRRWSAPASWTSRTVGRSGLLRVYTADRGDGGGRPARVSPCSGRSRPNAAQSARWDVTRRLGPRHGHGDGVRVRASPTRSRSIATHATCCSTATATRPTSGRSCWRHRGVPGRMPRPATYAYVRSTEEGDTGRQDVALTPRHSAGLVGMWEEEDVGPRRPRGVLHRAASGSR